MGRKEKRKIRYVISELGRKRRREKRKKGRLGERRKKGRTGYQVY